MAFSEKTTVRHEKWKKMILQIVRETPNASRISIKRDSGLSMDSTLSLVEELLDEGLLETVGKSEESRAGRKATLLRIAPDGCYFLGVRYSAASMNGVCMNFAGEIVCAKNIDLPENTMTQTVLDALSDCIGAMIEELGDNAGRIRGIGIGAPGIIDLQSGIAKRYVHIPDWQNVPLKDIIESKFHLPVFVEHSVKCAARAVLSGEEHRGCQNMLYLKIDRGLHMCVVIDGHIFNGENYLSGEIGHFFAEDNHLVCGCGKTGCLETVATSDAVCRAVRREMESNPALYPFLAQNVTPGSRIRLKTVCQSADAGDTGSIHVLEHAGEAVGRALANCATLLNPKKILVAGPITESPHFTDAIRVMLCRHCLPESMMELELSFIHGDALQDALGAAQLPYSRLFELNEKINEATLG